MRKNRNRRHYLYGTTNNNTRKQNNRIYNKFIYRSTAYSVIQFDDTGIARRRTTITEHGKDTSIITNTYHSRDGDE